MNRFTVVERPHSQAIYLDILTIALAIVVSMLLGGILFWSLGYDALQSLHLLFVSPLTDSYNLSEIFVKMIPLCVIAVGLSACFRANVWNIGAEGQYICGALAGTASALYYADSSAWVVIPLSFLAGTAGGVLWASIPAILKAHCNVNEILTSLMLNYVAFQILVYLLNGPMRDPEGFNFPETALLSDAATLPVIFEGTRIHAGAIVTIALLLIFWFVFSRTSWGYQLTVFGQSPPAARFASISAKKMIYTALLISGATAGMAGVIEVAGPAGQVTLVFPSAYGYTAIIVVFLSRMHPIGIIFGAFLISIAIIGSELTQIELGMPLAVSGVFQGILLFFIISGEFFRTHKIVYKPIVQTA